MQLGLLSGSCFEKTTEIAENRLGFWADRGGPIKGLRNDGEQITVVGPGGSLEVVRRGHSLEILWKIGSQGILTNWVGRVGKERKWVFNDSRDCDLPSRCCFVQIGLVERLGLFLYRIHSMYGFYNIQHVWNIQYVWVSLVAQTVKNLPAMWETWVWSLGREDPLEKGMATHSSILDWRIPWTENPGRLQSMGSRRAGYD